MLKIFNRLENGYFRRTGSCIENFNRKRGIDAGSRMLHTEKTSNQRPETNSFMILFIKAIFQFKPN